MHRLETQNLGGFNDVPIDAPSVFEVTLPDGRQLSHKTLLENTPAVTSEYDGMTSPQAIIRPKDAANMWDESRLYPVARINFTRGRTLDVITDRVEIEDKHGNVFNSLNIKGSDLSDPYFLESATASRDFIIHGLQESLVMERVLKASGILRQAGIGTEYIMGLVLPKRFPVPRTDADMKAPENLELPELLERLAASYAGNEQNLNNRSSFEVKTDMVERFSDCDYLVSYRAMDSRYRFNEIGTINGLKVHKAELKQNYPDPNIHEYLDDAGMDQYLLEDVIPNIADNLAGLHNAGLTHGFLHSGNITARGSLVDLDSVKGEPLGLGDAAITEDDIAGDIARCVLSILDFSDHMEREGEDWHEANLNKQLFAWVANNTFLERYLGQRCENPNDVRRLLTRTMKKISERGVYDFSIREAAEHIGGVAARILPRPKFNIPELQQLSSKQIQATREFSALSLFPSSYLSSVKHKALDKEWLCDPSAKDYLDEDEEAFGHPIKAQIESTRIGMLAVTYPYKRFGANRTTEFLSILHAGLGDEMFNRSPEEKAFSKHVREHVEAQRKQILNEFCKPNSVGEIPGEISATLNEGSPNYRSQIGFTYVDKNPIFFPENDEQYKQLLEKLIANTGDTVEGIEHEQFYSEVNGDTPMQNKLYVLDPFAAEEGAKMLYTSSAVHTLTAHYPGKKPPIAIQGIMSQQPRLQVPRLAIERTGIDTFRVRDFLEQFSSTPTQTSSLF